MNEKELKQFESKVRKKRIRLNMFEEMRETCKNIIWVLDNRERDLRNTTEEIHKLKTKLDDVFFGLEWS